MPKWGINPDISNLHNKYIKDKKDEVEASKTGTKSICNKN